MKMGMLMDKIDFTSEMFFLFMGFHHEMDDFLMCFSIIWRWCGWDADGDQHQQSCNADQQHEYTEYTC